MDVTIIPIVLGLVGGIGGLFLGLFIWKISGYIRILVPYKHVLIAVCIISGLILLPFLYYAITTSPSSQ